MTILKKEPSKEEKYDLSKLSEEQFEIFHEWWVENKKSLQSSRLDLYGKYRHTHYFRFKSIWGFSEKNEGDDIIDARELFEGEWVPEQGEEVLVSDDAVNWRERIFVTRNKKHYYCENDFDEDELTPWKFIKQIRPITERIKTLEDAIVELGENDIEVIELRKLERIGITSHVLYHQQVVVIAKVLNEGWEADFSDSNQVKYTPHYKASSAGGFVFSDYDYWHAHAFVGSRLCFPTPELAKYFATQFIEIHNKYL